MLTKGGRTYPGKHPIAVTVEEFDRVQELLGRPGRPRRKTHQFAFTGLIRCGECGFAVTAEHQVNRHGSRYTYYHCSKRRLDYRCGQPSISAGNLEAAIFGYLEEITVPEAFHDWALQKLERTEKRHRGTVEAQQASIDDSCRPSMS